MTGDSDGAGQEVLVDRTLAADGAAQLADAAADAAGRVAGDEVAGQPGPVAFWHVSDIKNSLQLVLEAGGQIQQAVRDVRGGKLVATARDAEGNLIGFIQIP